MHHRSKVDSETRQIKVDLGFINVNNMSTTMVPVQRSAGLGRRLVAVFSVETAITTFKLIQNAKAGGVLENSGYLLPDGH